MKKRTVLHADDGKVLTNGEVYGKHILLAEGISSEGFYEIPDEEYQRILDNRNKANETM